MKFQKLFPAALLIMAALFMGGPPAARAQDRLILWGRQNPADSAKPRLQCNQLKLTRPASVEVVEGTARVYCFVQAGEIGWCGGDSRSAVGKVLQPGVYSVLPGLVAGQDQAYIRLYLKYVSKS